jgi:arginase
MAGEVGPVRFQPDLDHPKQQNLTLVVDVAKDVAALVDRALGAGRFPLVLGGDCSLSLGVIAGLLRHQLRLGVIYFDADLDLNTPETTPSGILDGMALAHALGRGVQELAGIGPRLPMLSEPDVVVFGRSRIAKYPIDRVRQDPAHAARDALSEIEDQIDALLVHFDVDVTDCPAVDVPHPGGLDLDSAFSALSVFTASPKVAALVVTEFNAELDSSGLYAKSLVAGLADALRPRTGLPPGS